MTSVDASTRGRRNRANGASAERDVARWLRPWWPDACRAIRNTSPDPGDIDLTSPGLFWSVKNTQEERIGTWLAELDEKADDRFPLLVVRRRGHSSPGEWWCWTWLSELVALVGGEVEDDQVPVRLMLRDVLPLLVQANYAPKPKGSAA